MFLFFSSMEKSSIWQYVFIDFKLQTQNCSVELFHHTFDTLKFIWLCCEQQALWATHFPLLHQQLRVGSSTTRSEEEGCSLKTPKSTTLSLSGRQRNEPKYKKNSQVAEDQTDEALCCPHYLSGWCRTTMAKRSKANSFFYPQMSDQGTIFKPLCVNKFVFSCYHSGTFSLWSF